jgi:hypothetical protein
MFKLKLMVIAETGKRVHPAGGKIPGDPLH